MTGAPAACIVSHTVHKIIKNGVNKCAFLVNEIFAVTGLCLDC